MALNIPEAFVCRYVFASFGHKYTKFFQSCSHWLFQATSVVLPTTVACAGLLVQSLACLGQSQRLDSCSDSTSSLQWMPVNALTPATKQLTRAFIWKRADRKGVLYLLKVAITLYKNAAALERWMIKTQC